MISRLLQSPLHARFLCGTRWGGDNQAELLSSQLCMSVCVCNHLIGSQRIILVQPQEHCTQCSTSFVRLMMLLVGWSVRSVFQQSTPNLWCFCSCFCFSLLQLSGLFPSAALDESSKMLVKRHFSKLHHKKKKQLQDQWNSLQFLWAPIVWLSHVKQCQALRCC